MIYLRLLYTCLTSCDIDLHVNMNDITSCSRDIYKNISEFISSLSSRLSGIRSSVTLHHQSRDHEPIYPDNPREYDNDDRYMYGSLTCERDHHTSTSTHAHSHVNSEHSEHSEHSQDDLSEQSLYSSDIKDTDIICINTHAHVSEGSGLTTDGWVNILEVNNMNLDIDEEPLARSAQSNTCTETHQSESRALSREHSDEKDEQSQVHVKESVRASEPSLEHPCSRELSTTLSSDLRGYGTF